MEVGTKRGGFLKVLTEAPGATPFPVVGADWTPASAFVEPSRPKPVLHLFEAGGGSYLFSPGTGNILKLDQPLLKALVAKPLDVKPDELRDDLQFVACSQEELEELVLAYQDFADQVLSAELAPVLSNIFDQEGYFERHKDSIDHFAFIPTHQCNMRCTYCTYTGSYEGHRVHEDVNVTPEIMRQTAQFIRGLGKDKSKIDMIIYGGESLISWATIREFHEILRASLPPGKLLFFKITTNGLLLSDEIIDYCIDNDIWIQVSLDGPRHVHDRYRVSAGGKPTFDAVYRKLLRIYQKSPAYFRKNVSISAVFGPPYDLEETNEWFRSQEMFAGHGFRERNFILGHIESVGTSFFDGQDGFRQQWTEARARMRELYLDGLARDDYDSIRFIPATMFERKLSSVLGRMMVEGGQSAWVRPDCIPGEQLAINPLGQVFICIQTTDFVPIGDVWNGLSFETLRRTRELFLDKKNAGCRACWAYKYCDMCVAKMNVGKVLDNVRYSEHCDKTRTTLSQALQLYVDVLERAPQAIQTIAGALREG
jgi:uncharacterized protein